jgi:hypothetical protein
VLVAVTISDTIVHVLRAASLNLTANNGVPLEVMRLSSVKDAVKREPGAAFMVLDLRACASEEDLVEAAVKWKTGNASGQLLLIEGSRHPQENTLLWYLGRLSERPPLTVAEANDRTTWESILLNHPFSLLMAQVQEAFLALTKAYHKPVPNLVGLTEMLMFSPQWPRVKQHVKPTATATLKTALNSFTGTFVSAGQAPPSEIISAFRLVVYLHLRKHGWPLDRAAAKLGCDHCRQLRTSFNQRLGCGFRELVLVEPQQALEIVANLVTPGHHEPLKKQVAYAINTARERTAREKYERLAPILPTL